MTDRELFDFSRHNEAAVRVYLQNWIINHHLGFNIHPEIKLQELDHARVIDIACGTAIWLIDVASSLPKSAQLDGCDVSSAHFPLEEELPSNVKLMTLDAGKPFPPHLHGQYDLVHIGRVSMYVRDENPRPLLENLVKLLKPGGYLQWDDLDVCGTYIQRSSKCPNTPNTDKLTDLGMTFCRNMGCGSDWLDQLPSFFRAYGLDPIDSQRIKITPEYAKAWTSMQLMANHDYVNHDIVPATVGMDGWPDQKEWQDILEGVERESAEGTRALMDITYTIGKKEQVIVA